MISRQFLTLVFFLSAVFSLGDSVFAEGGTSIVAAKGQSAYVSPSWAEGVGELVNDASRTSGWNSWFSEWPNDVNQYAFEIQSTDDLNRLIKKLAEVKTDLRQIRLSHLKEPRGLGWGTCLPEGNGIAVIFSIGDQALIDRWYQNVRKPFGVMKFTAAPVAVPPTLTIFVQNESVELEDLEIPEVIDVAMGGVPTLFHKSNTTLEQERGIAGGSQDGKGPAEEFKKELDAPTLAAAVEIELFLDSRKGRANR